MSIFKNRAELLSAPTNTTREKVLDVLDAAVASVEPERSVKDFIEVSDNNLAIAGENYALSKLNRLIVVGGGKAALPMVRAFVGLVGNKAVGIVNAPRSEKIGNVICNKARHPVPDESGENGAREMMKLVESATAKDLVVCLISGGGSSMMPLPEDGISLEDEMEVTKLLLASGADITEMNAVRKHLSKLKGGKLARAGRRAKVVSLILSDVVGDPLDSIASGPTAPDPTTYADAISVLQKYHIWDRAPGSVRKLLSEGKHETPKPMDPLFERVRNIIIGNNDKALNAAEARAVQYGYHTTALPGFLKGEARDLPHKVLFPMVSEALENGKLKKPAMVIMGGETTVTMTGSGTGGRNQETALSALIGLMPNWTFASMGTDGIDGNSDAAGAISDSAVSELAMRKGLRIMDYLENNDSSTFFAKTNGLLITGPTGTNVTDIAVLVVE